MTNKDITKIYFCGDEITALYQGSTLIFKKSSGGGKSIIRGKVDDECTDENIIITYNGNKVSLNINTDKTFEYDTDEVLTNGRNMFYRLGWIEKLDVSNFDTSNVTDMYGMLEGLGRLTSLDVSNFDTSNVTNMYRMFEDCAGLTSLDVSNFDTSNVTNMGCMFWGCQNITSLDVSNFDTSNVTNMGYMFIYCTRLIDLYLNFNVGNTEGFQQMFGDCISLTNVVGKFEGTENNLDLHYSPLTAASAMVFINGLATVTEKRTLKLSATTYDSLTPEQIAIATSKGWTVTRN